VSPACRPVCRICPIPPFVRNVPLVPHRSSERFPTKVRATAVGLCYHQGAIFGGPVAPVLTYIAVSYDVGFGVAIMVGTTFGLIGFIIALILGPEAKGQVLGSDVVVI
jgi:SHS family lactate transporter-like MFS transporter